MLEILKKLYGEAVTEESLERFKEELGKKYVPKAEFNRRGEEIKMLRMQLAEQDSAAVGMQAAERRRDALQQELEMLKEQYAEALAAAKRREAQMHLQSAVDRALTAAKARNLTAVKALLNMEGISLENGQLVGLEEQLAQLKQENGFLFEAGEGNLQFMRPSGGSSTLTPEEFRKMTYMERLKLKKEQPGLYRSLI